MTLDTLSRLVHLYSAEDADLANAWAQGSLQQPDRLEAVADWCAASWPGDLAEIGCYTGGTTRRLAMVAQRYGRRVVTVDPWETGTQNCKGGEYEKFLRNIADWQDLVDVVRLPSQNLTAVGLLKTRDLCFAYLDGLHTYEALLGDILTVAHCAGVIAVDDIKWRPDDLRRAFYDGAEQTGREAWWHPPCREGYLLPVRT
jgi:predicted O-methyltransferase YrrM